MSIEEAKKEKLIKELQGMALGTVGTFRLTVKPSSISNIDNFNYFAQNEVLTFPAEQFSINAADTVAPKVSLDTSLAARFEAGYSENKDGSGNLLSYDMKIVWDANKDNDNDIAQAGVSILFTNATSYNKSVQPLYDDGTHGDLVAGDNKWSFVYNIPVVTSPATDPAILATLAADLSGGNANVTLLKTETKDLSDNNLQAWKTTGGTYSLSTDPISVIANLLTTP